MAEVMEVEAGQKTQAAKRPENGTTFTVPAGVLASAIGASARATASGTIPILSHVLLTWGSGAASVVGTDMERAIKVEFPVAGGSGECVAPAAVLLDAAKRLAPDAEITLAYSMGGLALSCGKFRATLRCLEVAEFPAMDFGKLPTSFVMSSALLMEMLRAVTFCASTDTTRHYLQGVYLHVRERMLIAVATDGVRLGRIAVDVPTDAADMEGVIIPTRTATEIVRLIDGAGSDVRMQMSSSRMVVGCGRTTITSKLIDGQFPDYDRVIPKDNPLSLLVRKKDIMRAVEAVSGVSGESGAIIITASASGGAVVTASNLELGSATDEIADAVFDGEDIRIAFLLRNILPICSALSERLDLRFGQPSHPVLITDLARPELLYVTVPLRV